MAQPEQTSGKGQTSPQTREETTGKYLMSFAWMLLVTVIAFVLVGLQLLPENLLILVILGLAALQVLLQLFTFMHLDFGWYRIVTIFMCSGCIVAATAIIAMLYWV
ncbi:MAG: cytochrome C oxidase subunit IV family protein [Firmicutes bacterium]|uniref:Cytochrome c oxidase subunit 4 n=1 Tax=Melghirimyces thermohalophilus TaxID=1236220 RepID=A0A1G6KA03_9BACL|nr:cytochrome C oxidase subunit IV family protein [Melghirimyces thermohalophilus]MDA8354101.1 cytochrome C oxidase subunit IV family protein [Bacillota bacterium]SDC27840.1 cytochrome c oxidase subunit 4 [Melghirimyces thermohalophilus]